MTALFSKKELDWFLFSPVMVPKGLSFAGTLSKQLCAAFAWGFCMEVTLVALIRDCLQPMLATTWGLWCPLPCLFTEQICALNVLNQEHSGVGSVSSHFLTNRSLCMLVCIQQ